MFSLSPLAYFWSCVSLVLVLSAEAQVTLVPDTLFEARLIQLNIDSDGVVNGQVATADVNGVTSLDISSMSIHDFTGLQDFVALKWLNCSNNPVNSFSLAGLASLEFLRCTHTNISSLDASPVPNLQELILLHNFNLTTIDIDNNTALTNLELGYCPIATLDITNNVQLRDVVLYALPLTILDASTLVQLQVINIYDTDLSSISLPSTSTLRWLYLIDNQLTQLDVSQNPALEELYCHQNFITSIDLTNNSQLRLIDLSDNQLTSLDLSNKPNLYNIQAEHNFFHYVNAKSPLLYLPGSLANFRFNAPSLHLCVLDSAFVSQSPTNWYLDTTATYTEVCSNTSLLGHVRADSNNNCLPDPQEIGLGGQIITMAGVADTFYSFSNGQGLYTGELLPGTYQLSLSNNMPYRNNCVFNQNVVVDSIGDRDTMDWAVYTEVECAFLQVSLNAPFLRAAGGGSAYTINYCNLGTADAHQAYVEVLLDSQLQVITTSWPIQSQVGHLYTFYLDTIPQNTCGAITIQVASNPNAPQNYIHCSEVHIYPDTLCVDDWMGPVIESKGNCEPDSVHFRLYNTGGTMLTAQTYSIFEDHVMLFTGPFTLGAGDSLQVSYPSQPGKVYRIEATQAVGIPPYVAGPIAHTTTLSCLPNATTGEWNMDAILQFYQGDKTPWVDVDCQPSISSYDPNDKAAHPVGYGSPHYITKGTALDYKVRFQNTGNDTAFTVVIVDTLSPFLDPSTLSITASSHPYTWTLSGAGILRMTFNDIKLVDSMTNEPLSHGFFTYQIEQKSTAALGAVIENTAAIYFDYNPPIFTNTTFHTLGVNFYEQVVIDVDRVWVEQAKIKVYPNPFQEQTTLQVEGGQPWEELTLEVMDVTGRVVQQISTKNTNQILLSRKELVQGLYFYRLLGNNQLIGTGKLQVQ